MMKTSKKISLLTASCLIMAGSAFAIGPVGKTWVGGTIGLVQFDEGLDDAVFGSIDANVALAPNFDIFGGSGAGNADGPGVEQDASFTEVGVRLLLPDAGSIVPFAQAALVYGDSETDYDDATIEDEDDDDFGYNVGAGIQVSPCEWSNLQIGVSYEDLYDDGTTSLDAGVGAKLGENFQLWLGGSYDLDEKDTTETLSLNLLF